LAVKIEEDFPWCPALQNNDSRWQDNQQSP